MIDYEPKSWIGVLVRLHGSIAPRLVPRTLVAAGLGAIAAWAYHDHAFKLPSVSHTMIGVALGLLLVFRTNASFDRWWEGRKLFGFLVNRTRDVARQLAGYASATEAGRATVTQIVRWLELFFALVLQSLRNEKDLASLGPLLTSDERATLEPTEAARAGIVLAWITRSLDELARTGVVSEIRLLAIDANLAILMDSYSGCERIARTPVPFAYAQHIKLFVTLFCFTVPFVLVDGLGWSTPVASACLAYALFGIDEIGVEIEDPFGYDPNDLPGERIGRTIATSINEITSRPLP
jgi:putative membrane protein